MHQYVGQKTTPQNFLPKAKNRLQTIFLEIILMKLRFVGHIPIHTVRKFFYLLCGLKMPLNSTIHMWANFYDPRNITIGQDTIVGDHCFLDGRAPLTIGSHVGIASQVLIYNDEHDINSPNYANSFGPVTIKDYVFIGPRVIILPNVTIGRGAVVAAGAVVTKDIPDLEIWGGVPAKKISDRKIEKLDYQLGRPTLFQ